MKRGHVWWVLAVLPWLGPGSAGAQGTGRPPPAPPPAGEVRRAEPVVVTATRSEQPLEEIGASVTVVPEEAMRVQEYRAVEQVLRTIPGVQVETSGAQGSSRPFASAAPTRPRSRC